MKRLKLLLNSMMTDTKTYKEMYEGRITFIDPSYGGAGIADEVEKNGGIAPTARSFSTTSTEESTTP